jgi:hypothetical protein
MINLPAAGEQLAEQLGPTGIYLELEDPIGNY